jgi:hypothetical protein
MSNAVRVLDRDGVIAFVPWEVIYRLGLAVEQGQGDKAQREQFGDQTVDFVNELTKVMIDEGKVPR